MKNKKFFVVVLAMLMTLCFGMFVACGEEEQKEATKLTVDSKTEATIEVGQAYTLQYTCNGTVTVTVSGGNYDEASQKFTASEPGNYTITVKGVEEGKTETVVEVKITVVAGADRSALSEALEKYDALTNSDYTSATWSKARSAAAAADEMLETDGVSQEEIDEAAQALEDAIAALVPAAITKAETSEESIVWNGTTYLAADYKNFDEILGKVNALNADTNVKLRSEYTKQIEAILAQFNAKLMLSLTGGLTRGGAMLVSALREYKIGAESVEGATFAWKVDGTAQSATGAELSFTPTEYGKEYTIECTATKGDETNTKSFTVSFEQAVYQNNMGSGITVTDDVIEVTKNDFGWGDQMGKKVSLPDLYLKGEFSVTFDLTFTEAGSNSTRCMALFLLNADGNQQGIWYAVVHQTPWLEVTFKDAESDKIRKEMPSGTVDVGKVMHFSMNRVIKDGTAYLTADLLDDSGNIIFHNDGDGKTTANDAVMLGFQAEFMAFKVENLAVKCADLVNLTALRATAEENRGKYTAEDYDGFNALQTALTQADVVLAKKGEASAAEVKEAIEGIQTAVKGLKPAAVVKATADDTKIAYKDKEYKAEDYEAASYASVKGKIEELNAREDIATNSAYRTELEKLLDELIPFVSVTITGIEERVFLVSELPEELVTLTATAREGATFAWEVDGTSKGTLSQIQITPEFKLFTVKVTATFEGRQVDKTIKFGWEQVTYQNNKPGDIAIENDVITVNKDGIGWGDTEGRKVILNDAYLKGNFTVYFDLKFTYHWGGNPGDANVFALFLLDSNGNSQVNWVAVCQQVNKLETAFGGDGWQKPQMNMPDDIKNADGTTKLDTVLHFSVTREIIDGRAYLIARLLKDDGTVWLEHTGIRTEGGTERLSKDYTGPVLLGIQVENTKFELSHISVSSDSEIVGKAALRKAVQEAQQLVLSDYTETNNFQSKLTAAQLVLLSDTATRANVESALAELRSAMEDLAPKAFEKAAVGADTISYNGREYKKASFTNFDTIKDQVTALNARDIKLLSQYERELTALLAQLDPKIKAELKGVENLILNTLEGASCTFTAETESADATFAWKIDGASQQGTAKDLTYTPTFGEHTVEVTVSAGGAEITVEKSFTVLQATFKAHSDNASTTKVEGNTFSAGEGLDWNDWNGRNLVLEDLVFNGSFSLTADITWDKNAGGANVVTFHLINADTMSPDTQRDNATFATWGCICLHENPKRLELTLRDNKQQKDLPAELSSQINEGTTFTVRFTVLRQGRLAWLKYAVLNPTTGEWFEFERPDTSVGDFDNGFYVGVNIEHAGVTMKNFRYETLSESGYITGSVASKAALHKALQETEEYYNGFTQYEGGQEFRTAWRAAFAVYTSNGNGAESDYAQALEALNTAKTTLLGGKRAVKVTIPELDAGYTTLSGVTSLKATIEGAATDVKWTWGENGSQDGDTLTLQNGTYQDLTLHFKVGGQQYDYKYYTLTVKALTLKSNRGEVVVDNDAGKATITNGGGWDPKDQLVIDGVQVKDFELTFKAKYTEHNGDFRVFCINLFGSDVRPVFGYQREGRADRMQMGFDNLGGNTLVEIFKDSRGEDYNYIHDNAATFSLKMHKNADGIFELAFTVYGADGHEIQKCESVFSFHLDTRTTAIQFTFENVNLELTDFTLKYFA